MAPAYESAFVPFGAAHLGAVGLTALASAGLARLVRARPRCMLAVRVGLLVSILVLVAAQLGAAAREGWFSWPMLLPLHLCDAALMLALASLAWPRQPTVEVLYFWANSGSALAMLTPDLPWGFPRWEFVSFFGLHGLVIVAAWVLVSDPGLAPRRGAPWRAFVATLALAVLAGIADWLLGANFMFLRWKPQAATPLDWMGPWPVYILVGAIVAAVLFQVLALPFLPRWRQAEREAARDEGPEWTR